MTHNWRFLRFSFALYMEICQIKEDVTGRIKCDFLAFPVMSIAVAGLMQNPIHMKNNTLNNCGFAALAVGLCCLLPLAAPATAHAQSQLGKNLGENGWGEPGGHAGDHIQLGGDPASSRYNSQLAHTDAKPICELSRDFSGDLPISQLLTTHAVNAASQEDSAQAGQNKPPRQMDFTADKVEYDSQQDIVTASGDVLVESNGQKLEAQKIVWNRITGDVSAFDQVKITHDDGTVIYGEHINLKDNLEVGTVENILLVLEEGARIVARSAERRPDEVLLNYATYSPCAVTDDEGNPKNPSWQIRAVKVRYDEVKQRVHYDGARIEFFGLPGDSSARPQPSCGRKIRFRFAGSQCPVERDKRAGAGAALLFQTVGKS